MVLNQDFREFFESLNASDVRYLLVGGYAVAYHGRPRYTKDVDVWVDATVENGERLVAALARFGFGSLAITSDDFQKPDRVIQLGVAPNRIDLLTSIPGVEFADCYARKQVIDDDGLAINVISIEDLKASKRATGRLQDLADIEELEREDEPPMSSQ